MLRHDPYRAGYREGVANRFQFALPEPRPRDGWFRVGNLDITTTALLVIAGVASMFLYAISKETFNKLIFDPLAVRDGEIWRLFTWPIANPPSHIWLVLTLLFFWIIGHAVEGMVGRVRYTVLIVVITVVPAAIVTAAPARALPHRRRVGSRPAGDRAVRRVRRREPEHAVLLRRAGLDHRHRVRRHRRAALGRRPRVGNAGDDGDRDAVGADHGAAVGIRQAADVHPQVRRLDQQGAPAGARSSAGARSAVPPTSVAAWSRAPGRRPSRPAPRPTPPRPRSSSTSCSTRSRPAASTR